MSIVIVVIIRINVSIPFNSILLKCHMTEISKIKDLLLSLLHHTDKNHRTLKVTSKIR